MLFLQLIHADYILMGTSQQTNHTHIQSIIVYDILSSDTHRLHTTGDVPTNKSHTHTIHNSKNMMFLQLIHTDYILLGTSQQTNHTHIQSIIV